MDIVEFCRSIEIYIVNAFDAKPEKVGDRTPLTNQEFNAILKVFFERYQEMCFPQELMRAPFIFDMLSLAAINSIFPGDVWGRCIASVQIPEKYVVSPSTYYFMKKMVDIPDTHLTVSNAETLKELFGKLTEREVDEETKKLAYEVANYAWDSIYDRKETVGCYLVAAAVISGLPVSNRLLAKNSADIPLYCLKKVDNIPGVLIDSRDDHRTFANILHWIVRIMFEGAFNLDKFSNENIRPDHVREATWLSYLITTKPTVELDPLAAFMLNHLRYNTLDLAKLRKLDVSEENLIDNIVAIMAWAQTHALTVLSSSYKPRS